jgi:hypothetical protein
MSLAQNHRNYVHWDKIIETKQNSQNKKNSHWKKRNSMKTKNSQLI